MFGCLFDCCRLAFQQTRGLAVLSVAAICLSVAGCASKTTPPPQAHIYQAPQKVAGNSHRLRIEDDGIEEQLPPLRRRQPVKDDPTEPFSPNYGRAGAMQRTDASGSFGVTRQELPALADQDLVAPASKS